jgi:hypothetical protein
LLEIESSILDSEVLKQINRRNYTAQEYREIENLRKILSPKNRPDRQGENHSQKKYIQNVFQISLHHKAVSSSHTGLPIRFSRSINQFFTTNSIPPFLFHVKLFS